MSYPTDKGYVRGRVISTTAPDDKAAIWAVGPDGNNITDYRFYHNGAWESVFDLFNASQVGNTPPTAAHAHFWLDTNFTPQQPRVRNNATNSWDFLHQSRVKGIDSNYVVTADDLGTILAIDNSTGVLLITLDDIDVPNFQCVIWNYNPGGDPIEVVLASGVSLSGATGNVAVPPGQKVKPVRLSMNNYFDIK